MSMVFLRMRKGRLPLNPSYRSRTWRRRWDAHPRGLDAVTRNSVSKTQALGRAQPAHPPHCFPTWQPAQRQVNRSDAVIVCPWS